MFSLDPGTGVKTTIIGGPTHDEAPTLSPDGTKLVIFRADDVSLYISAADGSGLRRWAEANEIAAWNWSPDGKRLADIPEGKTAHDLIIWDGRTGPKRHLDVDAPANVPVWIDNDTLLLIQELEILRSRSGFGRSRRMGPR